MPLALWMGIVMFLHFWYMLILGKRNEWLFNNNVRFFKWLIQWQAYLNLLVDKRPGFWW